MEYLFIIEGTAADDQTWSFRGTIATETPDEFPSVPRRAISLAFFEITQGRGIFGMPCKGCKGPYIVRKLTVEEYIGQSDG